MALTVIVFPVPDLPHSIITRLLPYASASSYTHTHTHRDRAGNVSHFSNQIAVQISKVKQSSIQYSAVQYSTVR